MYLIMLNTTLHMQGIVKCTWFQSSGLSHGTQVRWLWVQILMPVWCPPPQSTQIWQKVLMTSLYRYPKKPLGEMTCRLSHRHLVQKSVHLQKERVALDSLSFGCRHRISNQNEQTLYSRRPPSRTGVLLLMRNVMTTSILPTWKKHRGW